MENCIRFRILVHPPPGTKHADPTRHTSNSQQDLLATIWRVLRDFPDARRAFEAKLKQEASADAPNAI
jgi:hypothetical protein